jgi:hypothetical protein
MVCTTQLAGPLSCRCCGAVPCHLLPRCPASYCRDSRRPRLVHPLCCCCTQQHSLTRLGGIHLLATPEALPNAWRPFRVLGSLNCKHKQQARQNYRFDALFSSSEVRNNNSSRPPPPSSSVRLLTLNSDRCVRCSQELTSSSSVVLVASGGQYVA